MKNIVLALIAFVNFYYVNAQSIVEGNNQFAIDLLANLKDQNKNVFFSPYSISTALFMTSAGARKETEKQMLKVLHQEQNTQAYHKKFGETIAKVQNKKSVQLTIANSIWPRKGYTLKSEFVKLLKSAYKVQITECDFAQNSDAEGLKINKWVEENTKNKIKDMIKPGMLDAATVLVLTNAIYFYGEWKTSFDTASTVEAEFHKNDGTSVKNPFMNAVYSMDYASDDMFDMISIPYKNNEVSMLVLLPNKSDNFNQAVNSLDIRKYTTLTRQLQTRKINLFLPKFKITAEFELQETLPKMGMVNAFGGSADFTGIANDSTLHISKVIHKAFIDVSEKGTEAAGATAVIVSRNGGGPITFKADHPFVFMIKDNTTGQLLFTGILNNPNE